MASRKKAEPQDWTAEDQAAARAQGWGLFDTIDEKNPKKIFYSIGAAVRANPDDKAIRFVEVQTRAGDALAIKAARAVFRSKAGISPKGK